MTSTPNISSINCFPSLIWVSVCALMVFTQQKVSGRDNKDLFLLTYECGSVKTRRQIAGPLILILVNQIRFISLLIILGQNYSLSDCCVPGLVLYSTQQWTLNLEGAASWWGDKVIIYLNDWAERRKKSMHFKKEYIQIEIGNLSRKKNWFSTGTACNTIWMILDA